VGPLYEPGPLTCYSDFLGTPAGVGDSVALQLDTSQDRLRMGPQLSTGAADLNVAANWTAQGNNTVAQDGSDVVITYVDDAIAALLDISGLTDYGLYRLTGTLTATGAFNFGTTNNRTSLTVQGCTAGANEIDVFFVSDGSTRFAFTGFSSGNVARLSSMSLRQVLGYHAYQDTTAARPLLGRWPVTGKRNVLLATEDWNSNPQLTLGAGGSTITLMPDEVDPFGNTGTVYRVQLDALAGTFVRLFNDTARTTEHTMSAYVKTYSPSGASDVAVFANGSEFESTRVTTTDAWQRLSCSCADAVTAGISNELDSYAVDCLVCLPQFEEGSAPTAYQKVAGATDIDITEAGVQSAYFLRGDGVDDYLEATVPEVTSGHTLALVGPGVTGAVRSVLSIAASLDAKQRITAIGSSSTIGVGVTQLRTGPSSLTNAGGSGTSDTVIGLIGDYVNAGISAYDTEGNSDTATALSLSAGMTTLQLHGIGNSTPLVYPGDIYFAASIDASITDAERTALLDYMRAETPA